MLIIKKQAVRGKILSFFISLFIVLLLPFLLPDSTSQVHAAQGEVTVPNIHCNSTYSEGATVTFTWDKTTGVSDFSMYDIDIWNMNYPFLDETTKMITNYDTNSFSFKPAHAGIYIIRISAMVENDNLNRGKHVDKYIKVGDPLSIKNVSISADCTTISGTYSRQCNTSDSITIQPVTGEGRSFYPRSILKNYTDSKTYSELGNCSFSIDISSYTVPDGQYLVTIKAGIDSFSTTYTKIVNINHQWNSGFITVPQGCLTDGEKVYTCSKCEGNKTEVIPAIGKHSWDSGRIIKTAGYTYTGIRNYTCTACGEKKTETIPKMNASSVTPGKAKITSAKVSRKKLTLIWKKVAKNTTGYQIAIKNKKNNKVTYYTAKASKKAKIKKNIKLKKGTYAVMIRAYNTINGETLYGAWSNVKSGKIK